MYRVQESPEIEPESNGHTNCPVCGHSFSNGGFPKHLRRHIKIDTRHVNSPGWWRGWVQGYVSGVREGRSQMLTELRNSETATETKK